MSRQPSDDYSTEYSLLKKWQECTENGCHFFVCVLDEMSNFNTVGQSQPGVKIINFCASALSYCLFGFSPQSIWFNKVIFVKHEFSVEQSY